MFLLLAINFPQSKLTVYSKLPANRVVFFLKKVSEDSVAPLVLGLFFLPITGPCSQARYDPAYIMTRLWRSVNYYPRTRISKNNA
ncbi:MAG: hypothetical protein ACI8RA_001825, partial [Chlamydiales bacterium]